jgi:hypothetical protein
MDYIKSYNFIQSFVKNLTVSFAESLNNLKTEFIFDKMFEFLRVYEECFKDFHIS